LPVLVAVPIGAALVHAAIGFVLLVVINALFSSGLHLSALAVPLVLVPYLVMLYGLSLVFAALGVYIRDLGQVAGGRVTAMLFTGAVFFPADRVPAALAGVVHLNPITWPIDAVRGCLLRGQWPDPLAFGLYSLVAVAVLLAGLWIFSVLRRGFADLL